jgi:hypothetical protein
MKSAYELAMERLARQAPSVKLTDAQKQEIAVLESKTKAKLAERELALRGEIEKSEAAGDAEAADKARAELADERRRLNERLEAGKEEIRRRSA